MDRTVPNSTCPTNDVGAVPGAAGTIALTTVTSGDGGCTGRDDGDDGRVGTSVSDDQLVSQPMTGKDVGEAGTAADARKHIHTYDAGVHGDGVDADGVLLHDDIDSNEATPTPTEEGGQRPDDRYDDDADPVAAACQHACDSEVHGKDVGEDGVLIHDDSESHKAVLPTHPMRSSLSKDTDLGCADLLGT